MILVFLGPPACGKGTQARRLAEERGLVQISTGDLLRDAVDRGTEVGKKAKSFMDAGQLVPDEIVIGIFADALRDHMASGRRGFILDGFPRTVAQATSLERALPPLGLTISSAIDFQIDREELIRRATGRRVCTNKACQATYHVDSNPPKKVNACDRCASPLHQREDDKAATVGARLAEYDAKTGAPLAAFYSKRGLLEAIDANRKIDAIAKDLDHLVDRFTAGKR